MWIPRPPLRILEIGCYEGLSSVFFADHFLQHPESKMTCVDPFLRLESNDHKRFLTNNEELNFDFNVAMCSHPDKIKVCKVTSDAFFKDNTETFDFIYIDGCHEPDFIARDMENAFRILESGGVMWMDDYRGGQGQIIYNAMNAFLTKKNGEYDIIHEGYQLAIQKKTGI